MCLTAEAYQERKWGPFPTLRKALEDKQIPADYYGFTSASDNMFDVMGRLIQIIVLAAAYEDEIKEIAISEGIEKMYRDLVELKESLEQSSRFFRKAADNVRNLCDSL